MSNISEEHIKYLSDFNANNFDKYISDGDSYSDREIIINTPPLTPVSNNIQYELNQDYLSQRTSTDNIPIMNNSRVNPHIRYFNNIDVYYYVCSIHNSSIKSFWLSFFTMYLNTLLRYIAISEFSHQNLYSAIILPAISLLNATLYKKIKYNNPSIDLVLFIFLKKKIKKFIIRMIAQISASILATITFYYIFKKDDQIDLTYLLSYSNYKYEYQNLIIVLIINTLYTFTIIKSIKTTEIYYLIIFEFISTALFINNVFNVINPINDITTRLTLLTIYKNYFNNLNIITNALASFCGAIFGVILYILIIDIYYN